MSINNITIVGNLGQDVEQKTKADNSAYWSFSAATSKTWKDKQGEKQTKVTWHKCVLYGNYANLAQYLRKGTQVAVVGEQRNEKYIIKDNDGNPINYPTGKPIMTTLPFIVVQTISLVGGKSEPQQQQAPAQQQQPRVETPARDDDEQDDLPF